MVERTDDAPWELLTRHFSGVASPDQGAALQRWIEAEAWRADFVGALRAAWDVTGRLPERHDSAAGWERVRGRISENASAFSEPRAPGSPLGASPVLRADARASRRLRLIMPERRRRGWVLSVLRVAAAVVGTVGLSTILWSPFREAFNGLVRGPQIPARMVFVEASTGRAQRSMLRLADGTRVTLGVASALRYPEPFVPGGQDARNVFLRGQAYFEVAHDSVHPFIVHARATETRVLGTRFVVRAYAGEEAVVVAVEEGEVALSPAGAARRDAERLVNTNMAPTDALILTLGDVGRLPPGGRATVVASADVRQYLAWGDGRLVFREAPLRTVLPELSRWYDLEVRFAVGADSLGARRFTGWFTDDPLDEVLTFLALATDVHVERNGHTVTISPKRGP